MSRMFRFDGPAMPAAPDQVPQEKFFANFFAQYDRVRVVSLRKRRDRRREMIASLRQAGAEDFEFFDAYRTTDAGPFRKIGSHGCYLSHLEILREAAEGNESVLVLQDDCDFSESATSYLVPDGTDIFYGGYFASSHPANPEISDIIGAHCMGFSAVAAKAAYKYLEGLLQQSNEAISGGLYNPSNGPMLPPIDGCLVWFRRSHPEIKTVFYKLCEQRSSRSDVSPHPLDRIAGVRDLMGMARLIRRSTKNWQLAPTELAGRARKTRAMA